MQRFFTLFCRKYIKMNTVLPGTTVRKKCLTTDVYTKKVMTHLYVHITTVHELVPQFSKHTNKQNIKKWDASSEFTMQ